MKKKKPVKKKHSKKTKIIIFDYPMDLIFKVEARKLGPIDEDMSFTSTRTKALQSHLKKLPDSGNHPFSDYIVEIVEQRYINDILCEVWEVGS